MKKSTVTAVSSTVNDTSKRRKSPDVSLQSLIANQRSLCNLPVVILVVVASLDNADKQLLASSFPLLERTLNLSVDTLGYFSMFTNLSYAISLPFWGWLVHKYGMQRIHIVLAAACASWGVASILTAISGSSLIGQAFFRCLNGAALGSILPLSQTMLVGMVVPSMRGRAFGFMSVCEKLAGTLAAASVVYLADWKKSYYCLGILSVMVAAVAHKELTPGKRTQAKQQAMHHTREKGAAGYTSPRLSSLALKKNDSDNDEGSAVGYVDSANGKGGTQDDECDANDNDHQPKLSVLEVFHRIARIPGTRKRSGLLNEWEAFYPFRSSPYS